MGLLGISLIVASVVLFCLRPPSWLPAFLGGVQQPKLNPPPRPSPRKDSRKEDDDSARDTETKTTAAPVANGRVATSAAKLDAKVDLARAAMPPPPPPPPAMPRVDIGENVVSIADDGETTPKATATEPHEPVPTFSLSGAADSQPSGGLKPVPAGPTPRSAPGLMNPPPPPRPPTLSALPAQSLSVPPSRRAPLPNRAPGTSTLPLPRTAAASSSSLAPPPTHSTKPAKPSRAVVLTPGHSPLDWARLSSPHSGVDLRGLGPSTGYLRVTPSMLKARNGRRGNDAWTVLGGRVYNMTPYLPFHPGGEPELLRGAGKDGTRLFGEIHPWVNYEGMLSACLIGVFVSEEEAVGKGEMEEMD